MKTSNKVDIGAGVIIVLMAFGVAAASGLGWSILYTTAGALTVYYIAVRTFVWGARGFLRAGTGTNGADSRRFLSWHPGQLAIVWVGVLLADRVLVALSRYNFDRGYADNYFWAAICALTLALATSVLLWISWEWFGARK